MTTTVKSKAFVKTDYNFTETNTNSVQTENESVQTNCDYTYGSGDFEVNVAVKNTGTLSPSGVAHIDLTSITKNYLDYTSTVSFSGIKNICIANLSTAKGSDILVRATGTNAFTNLFNGGSGNLLIKPYSCFVFNNPYTTSVAAGQKNLQIHDIAGSGAPYSIGILGNFP